MITKLLQSIGIVFTLLIVVAVCLISMYLSYVLGIAAVITALVFITYHILSITKSHK